MEHEKSKESKETTKALLKAIIEKIIKAAENDAFYSNDKIILKFNTRDVDGVEAAELKRLFKTVLPKADVNIQYGAVLIPEDDYKQLGFTIKKQESFDPNKKYSLSELREMLDEEPLNEVTESKEDKLKDKILDLAKQGKLQPKGKVFIASFSQESDAQKFKRDVKQVLNSDCVVVRDKLFLPTAAIADIGIPDLTVDTIQDIIDRGSNQRTNSPGR